MNKFLSISTVMFQTFLTLMVLVTIYMVLKIMDTDDWEIINLVGLFTFQPFLAIVFSFVTIGISFLIGLPIRLNSKINQWWLRRPKIPFAGVILGVMLLILSFHKRFIEIKSVFVDDVEITKEVPNITICLAGWFLISFFLLHYFPLEFLKPTNRINKKV